MFRRILFLILLLAPLSTSQAITVTAYVPPHEGENVGYTKEMLKEIITVHALHYDLDPDLLICIADAESELNYNAVGRVNPQDCGLFQLNSYYTKINCQTAKDPWFASAWTAQAISNGELWRWSASQFKWKKCYENTRTRTRGSN